jgi:hypothetical protein
VISDEVIWCTARALMVLCCDDERVIGRAKEHLRDGNIEKYAAWMRVLGALGKLRAAETAA